MCKSQSWSLLFLFKHKTAYEMRISDWSSDVCCSDLIGLEHFRVAARGGFERQHRLPALHLGLGHLGLELELDTLLFEDLVRFLADVAVHARQDLVEELDTGDLGAQPAPHAAKLEPDHPAADHDHIDRKSKRLNSSP